MRAASRFRRHAGAARGVAGPVCALLALLGVLFAGPEQGAAAEKPAYRRWAIVASKPLEEKGLPDLLAAELSTRKVLELVERQRLRAITAELELAACFGSQAAGKRLQLGRLLQADALVLLALEEWQSQPLERAPAARAGGGEKKKFVKLVISECHYGARLRLEYLPYSADRLEALCGECARLVDQTLERFAGGIRQTIGLTHFLSKNLLHDYDHLQSGYAYLLEAALMGFPGVAVVETEEARAIRRELELAGDGLKDRVVPLFIEGEYEMSVAKPGAEPLVRLAVRATDGKQVRMQLQTAGKSLSEAPEWLRGTVAREIVRLGQAGAETGLGRKQQFAMLAGRADAFAQFGGFEQATGLREAALLLEPANVDQRLSLIGDYLRWHRVQESESVARHGEAIRTSPSSSPRAQAARSQEEPSRAQWATVEAAAGHLERLLRERKLNPREGQSLARVTYVNFLTGLAMSDPAARRKDAAVRKELAETWFWRFYRLFPALDCSLRKGEVDPAVGATVGYALPPGSRPASPVMLYSDWTQSACELIAGDIPGAAVTYGMDRQEAYGRTLDDLFRFLTEVASPDVPTPFVGLMFVMSNFPQALNHQIASGRLKAEDVRNFYERLKQTGKPLHAFYGRLGLLSLKAFAPSGEKLDRGALAEVDSLLAFVRERDNADPHYSYVAGVYDYALGDLRKEIARRAGGLAQEKRHRLPENPIAETSAAAQVLFEPIEGLKPQWSGLWKCSDALDVAWTAGSVLAIPDNGTARTVFQAAPVDSFRSRGDAVYSLCWDGKNFWNACRNSGIHVVSPSGEVIGQVTAEQGLPPYRNDSYALAEFGWPRLGSPLMLHPVSPGACVAIGSVGLDKRLWFARVWQEPDRPGPASFHVKVFHTATKTVPGASETPDDDPQEIFDVAWLAECRGGEPGARRLLLVGRRKRGGGDSVGSRRPPLAIDLDSLAVSVLPTGFPNRFPACVAGGHVVTASDEGIDLFSPPDQKAGQWTDRALVRFPRGVRSAAGQPLLLSHGGMLYRPGATWIRVDPSTWTIDHLRTTTVPYQDPFERYAVSAHYGLVGWNRGGQCCRISIVPCPSSPDDLAALYPYVPGPVRARHHRAVQAIRGLGGSVDTRWGFCRHAFESPEPGPYRPKPDSAARTIVYLPEGWRGGDAGLAHLEDLHRLRDLYLVRAAVSDQGLQAVGRFRELESLYLVETKATDAGLAHLGGLEQLVYLRLEGTAGGRQFTDKGLEHLRNLPNLQKLTLYGDGFSDEGLAALGGLSKLRLLYLLNARITQAGLEKLIASRKRPLVWHRDPYWWNLID